MQILFLTNPWSVERVKLRLHEINAFQFHLDGIHSGTDLPESCKVYTDGAGIL